MYQADFDDELQLDTNTLQLDDQTLHDVRELYTTRRYPKPLTLPEYKQLVRDRKFTVDQLIDIVATAMYNSAYEKELQP